MNLLRVELFHMRHWYALIVQYSISIRRWEQHLCELDKLHLKGEGLPGHGWIEVQLQRFISRLHNNSICPIRQAHVVACLEGGALWQLSCGNAGCKLRTPFPCSVTITCGDPSSTVSCQHVQKPLDEPLDEY